MALSAESADQTNQNQSEPAAVISTQPSTTTTDAIKIKDEEDDGDEEGVDDVPPKPIDGTGGGEPGPSTISTSTTTSTNTKPKIENTTKELTRSTPSPCSTSPPPPDYHLIEFTLTHKQTMISLLNGCIPEVSPADSLEDTNQIYWRLGSLVHFFNIMFDTRTVLCIHDITPPMPSLRHMNQNKLQNINRYIRFWLEQFYYCDEVIDTLRFEPGHMAMTTILVLNLLNSVRHCLPQLRSLFDAHWSPHLDSFTIELHSLVRFDQLNLLLQRALENERVAHQASKQGKKKLCEEVAELKANLEKSKAMVERLKVQVEKAKQQHPEPVSPPSPSPSSFQKQQKPGPSSSREPVSIMNPQHHQPLLLQHQQPPPVPTLQQQTVPTQQQSVPIHQQSQVLKSLLNHSSGSGTITITTTTGPCVSGGPSSISGYTTGAGSTVLVSPLSKQQFPASTSILTLSPTGYSTNGMQPILSPRRRGRPRKNPYSPSPPKSHKPTAYKPIQSKPTQQQPITFTTNTSNYNNKMTPTLGMSTHHQSLIIPGSTARTILSTVPIGPGMGQTVMVGPQHSLLTPSNSILTTTSTQPNSNVTFGGEKSVLLKKVKFNGPQTSICTSSTNQLFITSNPMVSLVQNPMVSGPINLLSPTLTCQPTSFIVSQQQQQQQQQPMVSITLQPVPTSSQSLIAPPVSMSQPITLGQSVSMGQSIPMGQSVSLGQQSITMGQHSVPMGQQQPVTITQNQPVSLLTSVSTTQPSVSSISSGPSLLVKSEPLPDTTSTTAATTTGSKLGYRPKRSSSSIITPNSNLLSNIKISPSGSATEAVADQLNRNKNLLNKLYTAKYPDARQIDHDNLAMYYTQKSACSIKCRLCSKRFPSMASFRVHFQEHADQWVFHCNWEGCGAFFLSNYKLKRHKRTHTGERPFVCERCGKSYTRSDKLKEHTKQCTVKGSGGTNEELKEEVKESGGGSSSSGSVVSDSGAPPSAPPSTSTGTLVTTLKRTKKGKTTNISVSNPPSPVMMTIYTQPNTTKPNPTKPNVVASSGGGTSVLAKIPNSKKKKVKKAKKDIKSLKFKIKCEQPFGSDSNNNNDNNDNYVLKEPENEEPIPEFVKLGNGKRKKKVKGIRLALKLDEPEEPEWNGNDELSNLCFPDTGEGDEMKVDDNDNDDEAD